MWQKSHTHISSVLPLTTRRRLLHLPQGGGFFDFDDLEEKEEALKNAETPGWLKSPQNFSDSSGMERLLQDGPRLPIGL